jgi:hypothetical protein
VIPIIVRRPTDLVSDARALKSIFFIWLLGGEYSDLEYSHGLYTVQKGDPFGAAPTGRGWLRLTLTLNRTATEGGMEATTPPVFRLT